MRLNLAGGVIAALVAGRADHRLRRAVHGLPDPPGAGGAARRSRCASITEPGLHFKIPLIDSVIHVDKRILDLENPAQEVIASDQKRLVVDAFARYGSTTPLKFYQTVGSVEGAQFAAVDPAQFGAAPRARRGDLDPRRARRARRR